MQVSLCSVLSDAYACKACQTEVRVHHTLFPDHQAFLLNVVQYMLRSRCRQESCKIQLISMYASELVEPLFVHIHMYGAALLQDRNRHAHKWDDDQQVMM